MDGVLVHQERLIPGADQLVKRLQHTGPRFLGLTNNRSSTPATWPPAWPDRPAGPEQAIWTSALATARFLDTSAPGQRRCDRPGRLTTALPQVG
jgi:5'-nucleotidase